MNTFAGRLSTLLILAAAVAAQAPAAPRTLTLEQAVQSASEKNLSLQRTAWDLEAKQRQNDKAWNVFLPSLSVSNTLSRANPAVSSLTGAEVKPSWTESAGLSVSLNITGNLLASLEAVQLNYQSGQVAYDLARRSLEKTVRTVYYSLLLEEENLKLTQDAIDRAAGNLAKVRANYQAGLVPDLDVLSAQVALEQLRPQLQQLQTVHTNNLGQFLYLLGLPLDEPIVLEGNLSAAVEKSLNLQAVRLEASDSPDVQRAQLSLQGAELNKKSLDLNSWIPTVSLSWSTAPTMVDLFDEVYSTRKAKEWQDNGSFSLRLSYSFDSLIPWTGAKENLLQAEDSVRKSRSQLEEARISSTLTRSNLVRSIEQAVQSLASLELNVKLAQKTYDLSLDSYNRGGKDLLAVQASEGDLNSARFKVLSQRYTLVSNVLSLEYELGVPFGTLLGESK